MTGIICMWHGLIVDIPDGWHLCDGTNGTPDLRAKFVRGAAAGIDPGGVGGSATHRHTYFGTTGNQNQDHGHQVEGYTEGPQDGMYEFVYDYDGYEQYEIHTHYVDFESDSNNADHAHTFAVFTSYYSTLPPYYDVVFIMKL